MEDRQLLSQYTKDSSQAAFAEIVARHVDLVYSTALRMVRIPALAEDVTQMVFANLARKAARLPSQVVVPGWLHRDACFTALDLLRAERRRQAREQEALRMSTLESAPSSDWEKMRPCLDEALTRLSATDRDALLLRFFEKRSLKETGAALGLGEDAARKRVARALEKLRVLLQARGITTTSAALSLALMANGIQSAPLGLAGTVAAAIASGVGIGASSALIPVIKTIFMINLKSIAVGAAVLASLGYNTHQFYTTRSLQRENEELRQRLERLSAVQSENERLASLLANAGEPGLTADQFSELLRLRGELARLRAHPPAAGPLAPASTSELDQREENTTTFTTELTAKINNGNTLVVGGWETSHGKRTFLLMTPQTASVASDAQLPPGLNPAQQPKATVTIQNTTCEMPESLAESLQLASVRAVGSESLAQRVLEPSEAEVLSKLAANGTNGINSIHSMITVFDGFTATISSGDPKQDSLSVTVNPAVTSDLNSLQLSIQATLTRGAGQE